MGEQQLELTEFKVSIRRTRKVGEGVEEVEPYLTTITGVTFSKLSAMKMLLRSIEGGTQAEIVDAIDVVLGDFVGPMIPEKDHSTIVALMCRGEIDVIDLLNAILSSLGSEDDEQTVVQPANRAARRNRNRRKGGGRGGR